MYISLFELMEDDGVYAAKLYSEPDFPGPYLTVREDNKTEVISVWYRGEEIYSRTYDTTMDDGTDIHWLPSKVCPYDLEKIKEACSSFWVGRKGNSCIIRTR